MRYEKPVEMGEEESFECDRLDRFSFSQRKRFQFFIINERFTILEILKGNLN